MSQSLYTSFLAFRKGDVLINSLYIPLWDPVGASMELKGSKQALALVECTAEPAGLGMGTHLAPDILYKQMFLACFWG